MPYGTHCIKAHPAAAAVGSAVPGAGTVPGAIPGHLADHAADLPPVLPAIQGLCIVKDTMPQIHAYNISLRWRCLLLS